MAKGFNKGAQMGGGGMMAQIQKMQQQLADAQARLAEETVTATAVGSAGGSACASAVLAHHGILQFGQIIQSFLQHL